jgi:hypothetical protein
MGNGSSSGSGNSSELMDSGEAGELFGEAV